MNEAPIQKYVDTRKKNYEKIILYIYLYPINHEIMVILFTDWTLGYRLLINHQLLYNMF